MSYGLRRGRVLASDQIPVNHYMSLPIRCPGILASIQLEHVFNEEGYNFRQPNRLLLTIGKPGDCPVAHEWSSIGLPRTLEYPRGVTNCSDCFACS